MIGRAVLQWPDLAMAIRQQQTNEDYQPLEWPELRVIIGRYLQEVRVKIAAKHGPGRVKQWLAFLKKRYPQATLLFDENKKEQSIDHIYAHITDDQSVLTEIGFSQAS